MDLCLPTNNKLGIFGYSHTEQVGPQYTLYAHMYCTYICNFTTIQGSLVFPEDKDGWMFDSQGCGESVRYYSVIRIIVLCCTIPEDMYVAMSSIC